MAGLHGAKSVCNAFRVQEGLMSLFLRGKRANVALDSICAYLCVPSQIIASLIRASKPGARVRAGFATVLHVFSVRSFSQVCDPVIKRITVNVVNSIQRPSSVGVEPRKAVRVVQAPSDNNYHTSIGSRVACDHASRLVLRGLHSPSKYAGFGVVNQLLSKLFSVEFKFLHLIPFISGVDITCRHQPEGNDSSFRPLKLGWCGCILMERMA